jgi:hypothetical protein
MATRASVDASKLLAEPNLNTMIDELKKALESGGQKDEDPVPAAGFRVTLEAVGLSVQRLVRPDCDNCGDPATYRAYHGEGGGVYVCEDCMRAHSRDHTQVRTIWPNA